MTLKSMEAKEQLVHRTERALGNVYWRKTSASWKQRRDVRRMPSVRVLEAMQWKMRDRETAKLDYSVGLNQLESLW